MPPTLGPLTRNTAIEHALATLTERVRAVTVEVISRHGLGIGSGVLWDATGLIVTNAHVARGRHPVVTLAGGRTVDSALVARDPTLDLAALHVEATDLPAAPIGDSDLLRTGALVVALGSPGGLSGAAALGIVHHPAAGGPNGSRWIAADVRLAPGSSGGPLADAAGRVVGINTLVAFGLALAVPSRVVMDFLQRRCGVTRPPAWSAS